MRTNGKHQTSVWFAAAVMGVFLSIVATNLLAGASTRQDRTARQSLTPLQLEIEKQRMRLSSPEGEERRDALTQLGSMHHPAASRAALAGLTDPLAIVRATAAASILSLPAEESATQLIPLLSDKDEFVRMETAYALGTTRSQTAVSPLVERLLTDKKDAVRGAAAVALGQIADSAATSSLASVLYPESAAAPSRKAKRRKKEQNLFVLRAAAHSLGQIGSRAGLAALIAVLQDDKAPDDLKRESAFALGMIGDPSAIPALRAALNAGDPYLSAAANDALLRILRSQPAGGS